MAVATGRCRAGPPALGTYVAGAACPSPSGGAACTSWPASRGRTAAPCGAAAGAAPPRSLRWRAAGRAAGGRRVAAHRAASRTRRRRQRRAGRGAAPPWRPPRPLCLPPRPRLGAPEPPLTPPGDAAPAPPSARGRRRRGGRSALRRGRTRRAPPGTCGALGNAPWGGAEEEARSRHGAGGSDLGGARPGAPPGPRPAGPRPCPEEKRRSFVGWPPASPAAPPRTRN